jgi:hypothetical protein
VVRISICLSLALALTAGSGLAQEAAPADEAPAIDPEALAVVHRAGDFLRDAGRFSFSAESGYEVVQRDGSKLEFGSARRYLVERPNHVRVETATRDGQRRLALFDGTTFVQADVGENAYGRADLKQPRGIDFLIDLMRERLDTPLPLAELLRNDPREAIEDSLEFAYVVGTEKLRGIACDHLALRNPDADLQLWIARGERPLVRRVVITYRTLEGQPSFRADLDDWSFAPEIGAESFRYTPPEGAERVRFDVRPVPAPAQEVSP